MHGSEWMWNTISICGVFAATVVASLGASYAPSTGPQLFVALVLAVLPVAWTPVMMIRSAIPICNASILLFDADTTRVDALTTDDTVIDDSTRAMALGVLMFGGGATLLGLHLALEQLYKPTAQTTTAAFTLLSLLLLGAGGYPMYEQATDDEPWSWSKTDPLLDSDLLSVCNTGSGAIFGPPLAARDRDTFYTVVMAAFFTSTAAVGIYAIVALVGAAQGSQRAYRLLSCGAGIVCVAALGLNTVVLSEAVFMGTNPKCAESILTADRHTGLGLVAMALGTTLLSMFTVFATRAHVAHPSQKQEMVLATQYDEKKHVDEELSIDAPCPPPAPASPKEWIGWTGEESEDDDEDDDVSHGAQSPLKRYLLPRTIGSQSSVKPPPAATHSTTVHVYESDVVTTQDPEWDDGGLGTSFDSPTEELDDEAQHVDTTPLHLRPFSYASAEQIHAKIGLPPPPPPALLDSYFDKSPAARVPADGNAFYFEQDVYKSADV